VGPGLVVIALRVAAWIALYAAVLRGIGAGIGTWAAGSLTTPATILIAVAAPLWLFLFFPSWFAWRVVRVHPLGKGRFRALTLGACWLSPFVRARDLASIRIFLDVAADRPFPAPADVPADAWTALAAALQAERQGSPARASRIVDALLHLPAGSRFPWLARVYGVDLLCAAAIERDDWETAGRYAEIGRGRLALLLSTLVDASAGRPLSRRGLWLRWALAPMRRRSVAIVRRTSARSVPSASVIPPPPPTVVPRPESEAAGALPAPHLRHVRLLGAAARGERPSLRELYALAASWQADLDDAALARVRARGLELGARDGEARARALRDAVLDELAELAAGATGEMPSAPVVGPVLGTLVGELETRIRARLVERVDVALSAVDPRRRTPTRNALDAWERWLALGAALEDLERCAGLAALKGLWYGGVRDAVWSFSCTLFDEDRGRSGWVAHMMFTWVADRAEILGDIPTTLLNRENARSALAVA
jgi:hypothetical protein